VRLQVVVEWLAQKSAVEFLVYATKFLTQQGG
jgi:hypothetical protein